MFPYSFWGHMSHHKFHLNRLQEPWCNNQGEMEPSIISFSIKLFNLEAKTEVQEYMETHSASGYQITNS